MNDKNQKTLEVKCQWCGKQNCVEEAYIEKETHNYKRNHFIVECKKCGGKYTVQLIGYYNYE